ncbi:divergent polysaccharide deacetylase family protein [Desulfonatronovibrio magnus]|uniref:divergent polysaccharide deacetylase family protein n=1 Tax=Desulfonatronovibrio magnus TaxID=698827 RepID=UPI00069856D2|nr:divergent polysaccharide deacetylase family protein [Desulfonatronovibrio magnus]
MASAAKKGKKKKKTTSSRKRTPLLGVRSLLWTAAFGTTLLCLIAILLLPHKQDPVTTHTVSEKAPAPTYKQPEQSVAVREPVKPEPPEPAAPRPFMYEERIGANFDLRVWEADMALLQTMSLTDQTNDLMVHKKVENRFFYGTPYHYQEIEIYTATPRDEFIGKLANSLKRFLSNATLEQGLNPNVWNINIDGKKTHKLFLEKIIEKPLPGSGKMAIIIDDLGGSLGYARRLDQLDFPVVFSILPFMDGTRSVSDYARANNVEIMLHLPMEPLGYPQGIEPGPGALFVGMDSNEIRKRVLDNIEQVPGAIGVNNHMGSRFTQDSDGMSTALEIIGSKGLFFLDSLTTPRSVAKDVAARKGVDFLKRHIFLDNIQDKQAILFQLSKAENLAIKQGMAIAIGHPYPETIQALQHWSRIRNSNVEVVRISELLSAQKYSTATRNNAGRIN